MQTLTAVKRQDVGPEIMATTLTLIDDSITYLEAREVLWKLLSDKINFHKIKNWSSQERYGVDDEFAQIRIPELQRELDKLQEILAEAKFNRKKLFVSSEIKISLVDM